MQEPGGNGKNAETGWYPASASLLRECGLSFAELGGQ